MEFSIWFYIYLFFNYFHCFLSSFESLDYEKWSNKEYYQDLQEISESKFTIIRIPDTPEYAQLIPSYKNFKFPYEPTTLHYSKSASDFKLLVKQTGYNLSIKMDSVECQVEKCYQILMFIEDVQVTFCDQIENCYLRGYYSKLYLTPNKFYTVQGLFYMSTVPLEIKFKTMPAIITHISTYIKDDHFTILFDFSAYIPDFVIFELYEYDNAKDSIISYNLRKNFEIHINCIRANSLKNGTYYLVQLINYYFEKPYKIIIKTWSVRAASYFDFNGYNIRILITISPANAPLYVDLLASTTSNSQLHIPLLGYTQYFDYLPLGACVTLTVIEKRYDKFIEKFNFVTEIYGGIGSISYKRIDSFILISWKTFTDICYTAEIYVDVYLSQKLDFINYSPIQSIILDENATFLSIRNTKKRNSFKVKLCLRPKSLMCLSLQDPWHHFHCEDCKIIYVDKINKSLDSFCFKNIRVSNEIVIDLMPNYHNNYLSAYIYIYASKPKSGTCRKKHANIWNFNDLINTDEKWIKLASDFVNPNKGKIVLNLKYSSSEPIEFVKMIDWIYNGNPYAVVAIICEGDFCISSEIKCIQSIGDLLKISHFVLFSCSVITAMSFFVLGVVIFVKLFRHNYVKLDCTANSGLLHKSTKNNQSKKITTTLKKHRSLVDRRKNKHYVKFRHINPIDDDFVGSDDEGYIFRVINQRKPQYRKQKINLEECFLLSDFKKYGNLFLEEDDQSFEQILNDVSKYDLNPEDISALGGTPYLNAKVDFEEDYANNNERLRVAYVPGLYGPSSYIIGVIPKFDATFHVMRMIFDHKIKTVVVLCSGPIMSRLVDFQDYFNSVRIGMKMWSTGNLCIMTQCIKQKTGQDTFVSRIDKQNPASGKWSSVETRHFHYTEITDTGEIQNLDHFMKFRKKVDVYHGNTKYPMLVLCENGCGLSAAFIAIDYNIKLIKAGSEFLNVHGYIRTLREVMSKSVQSIYDMRLIYEALNHHIVKDLQDE